MNTIENPPSAAATTAPVIIPVSPAPEAPPIQLGRVMLVIVVLIIIGLLAGFIPRWHQRNALRAATVELATPTVSVVLPKPMTASGSLILPAEIKPNVEAPIFARANGYLKRWYVDIGTQVKAGELLAEIDIPELTQQLEQARAELAQSEAALALAKTTSERWVDLLKTSSVSEQETAEKRADFALKTATVEASRANVHRLEEIVSFAKVTAPFAGTITARNTDVGDLIVAGSSKELFRLAQTATLRVYVRVPQSIARDIAIGQSAEVTIPEIPGRVFAAKVVSTAGAMTADSRTLLTQLEVDNSKNEILSGSYGQVRFLDTKVSNSLTIPSNTLLFRAEGPQVGIVQDGKVTLHTINIGRDLGPVVEVLDGVTANDNVVLNPADSLVSGTAVRILEASAKK